MSVASLGRYRAPAIWRSSSSPVVSRPFGLSIALAAALAAVAGAQGKTPPPKGKAPPIASGRSDTIPSQEYYLAYIPYLEGRFDEARKAFEKAWNSGLEGSNGRWVDSIPLDVMVGECNYQLGNHATAKKCYERAIRQYMAYSNFLIRVNWQIKNARAFRPMTAPRVPGFSEQRVGKLAQFPQGEPILQGDLVTLGKISIDTRNFKTIHVHEIVRTLAIAIRRYGELTGPLAEHDPLLKRIADHLEAGPTAAGHWSKALTDVLAGVALRARGRGDDAPAYFRRGLLAAGEFEHPLTSLALLELGQLALRNKEDRPEQYKEAGDFFEKAAHAALPFFNEETPGWPGVPDIVEEAFRYGAVAHRLANHQRPFSLAETMTDWAQKRRVRVGPFQAKLAHLQTSLLLSSAEGYAGLRHPAGDARQTTVRADSFLDKAKGLVLATRGEMGAARIGARLNHLEALVRYQQGKVAEGDAAIGRALDFQVRRGASLWLGHLAAVDAWGSVAPADVAPRQVLKLYETVLREPTRQDWQVEPLESLSVLVTPHGPAMERWFRKTLETDRAGGLPALEIADMTRRHRFCTALDFGGRLLALRWLLEGPREQLDDQAVRQRDALLGRFKEYAALGEQVARLKQELQALPLVIDPKADRGAATTQRDKLAELALLSGQQEVLLRQMAADRVHVPLLFPPQRAAKQVQESLVKGQALLVFFATTPSAESPGQLYAFLLTSPKGGAKADYPSWLVAQPTGNFNEEIRKLLREMGNLSRDGELRSMQLESTAWRETAGDIFKQLFTASPALGAASPLPPDIDELAIVPDSVLWYLPFEALQVPAGAGKTQSLISKYRVRYAPTMSLAMPDRRGRKTDGNLAVAIGQLKPHADAEKRSQAAFEELRGVVPTAVQLPSLLPAPSSVYSTLFDRLLVLDDVDTSAGPLGWRPIRGRTGTSAALASCVGEHVPGAIGSDGWMSLPWGGPDQMLLPGFHTPAEHGLGEKEKNPGGLDVFLSTCGLMATGSRTVLLSRWRTGGKTSFDLVREFAQELPQSGAARAWQRSVLLCTEAPLVPDQEPRVATGAAPGAKTGSHPFFWSGYLLVDTGVRPPADATDPPPKAAAPAAGAKDAR